MAAKKRYRARKLCSWVLPPYEGRARIQRVVLPKEFVDAATGKGDKVRMHLLDNRSSDPQIVKRRRQLMKEIKGVKDKIVGEMRNQALQLGMLDAEVAKREEILNLATKAPSVKEMRAATAQLFREYDLSPIKELIEMSRARGKAALPPRDRMALLKFLAEYEAPRPKSVDIQQDTNMNVSVGLIDFSTSRLGRDHEPKVLASGDEDEYSEFTHDEL